MKKYLVSTLLLLSISIGVWAQDNQKMKMTLEECVSFAIRNSNSQQSLQLEKTVAETAYRQSQQEYAPQISATLSQSLTNYNSAPLTGSNPSWTGNYGLNLNMPLFSGGSIYYSVKQSKLRMEQSDYQIKQAENQLAIRVVQAFLSVLGNDELLKQQEEILKTSEEQAIQGQSKFKAGSILESDYLLLESQLASDRYNIVNTKNSRNNSVLSLKKLLSLSPNQPLEIVAPDLDMMQGLSLLPTMDDVIKRAMQTMPDLKVTEYDVDIAKNGIKVAQAGYMPKLSLSAGITSGYVGGMGNYGDQLSDKFNQGVTVNLNVPIYSNGRNKSNVAQSKIRVQQAELQHEQNCLDIMQQVEQEYQNIVAGMSRYNAAEVRQQATQASFNAYEKQFEAGTITTADLLLQKNNYINALNEYIQSKYSYLLERAVLDIYMGENSNL
jgi:outer membrane protein